MPSIATCNRRMAVTVAGVVAALLVAACGGNSSASSSGKSSGSGSGSGSSSKTIKVGAALIGPKNDKSFNQATYEGLQEVLHKYPQVKLTSVIENLATDSQRTDAINTLAPIDNVVLGVSASFGPIFDQLASQFANTRFMNVTGAPTHFHPNVYAFVNDWGVPTYVAGVIAAHMTKSKVVGYVGGAEIPPTTQGEAGFKAGVASVDPSVRVLSNITGDFNDVAKAKAATSAMIADHADVIFPFLDAGIAGSYAAGKESGKNPAMFKLTIPDCPAYSNIVGTEVVNEEAATVTLLSRMVKGTAKPGATFIDAQDPQLETLKLCPRYAKDAAIARVTKSTLAAINSGKTKLPPSALNPRPDYPYQEGFEGAIQNAGKTG